MRNAKRRHNRPYVILIDILYMPDCRDINSLEQRKECYKDTSVLNDTERLTKMRLVNQPLDLAR